MKLELLPLTLELKVVWKLSRNQAATKNNFILKLTKDGITTMGEVAPNIRYSETPEGILEQFRGLPPFKDPAQALAFCEQEDIFHALKCALVCAIIDWEAQANSQTVEERLGIAPAPPSIPTSISVPIMDPDGLESYLAGLGSFPYVKVKISAQDPALFVSHVARLTPQPLRIDANEAFDNPEDFLRFADQVSNLNIQFMEQPFKAEDIKSYQAIRGKCPFEIMADESIEDDADFELLAQLFDSVNIKLMKTGGYLRAVELARKARSKGLKIMLGCMIESSLGISQAFRLASLADYYDLDGSLLLRQDPFHFIKEKEGRLALV